MSVRRIAGFAHVAGTEHDRAVHGTGKSGTESSATAYLVWIHIRVADDFAFFTTWNSTIVIPKKFDRARWWTYKGDVCIIPPNSFALARSIRIFPHPAQCADDRVGKSTNARWESSSPSRRSSRSGKASSPSNQQHTPLPAKIFANKDSAGLFFESTTTAKSYKDKKANTNRRVDSVAETLRTWCLLFNSAQTPTRSTHAARGMLFRRPSRLFFVFAPLRFPRVWVFSCVSPARFCGPSVLS